MLNKKKEDVALILAEAENISKSEAERRINSVLGAVATVVGEISESEPNDKNVRGKLSLVGFGTYTVKFKPGRDYRNPQTGGTTAKGDENDVTFKRGAFLKNSVNAQ